MNLYSIKCPLYRNRSTRCVDYGRENRAWRITCGGFPRLLNPQTSHAFTASFADNLICECAFVRWPTYLPALRQHSPPRGLPTSGATCTWCWRFRVVPTAWGCCDWQLPPRTSWAA